MEETSLSLLDRVCQETDSESWNRLVGLYAPLLKRWLKRYEVQHSDAEDLLQEVFTTLVRDLPKFRHNHRAGAFRSWLRTILVHRLHDFWRSRQYRPVATGKTGFLKQLDELAEGASRVSQVWNREHDQYVMKHLMDAIQGQFEPKTWQAFHRQVVDGLRADVVAAELGVSLGSVYAAKSRVLNALRRESKGLVTDR
ncbi:MAG: RNA polymerase sigma factor [Pirellulaceae bacterium]